MISGGKKRDRRNEKGYVVRKYSYCGLILSFSALMLFFHIFTVYIYSFYTV